MSDEKSKADRLAQLRAEMSAAFAEARYLVGPERANMLYPAEQVTMRELSRACCEATKEEESK